MSDLKQMQFVDNMSTRAVKMAESTYTSARDYTPKMLQGTVTSLEGTLQPYYTKAGDVSSNLLKAVDATVRQPSFERFKKPLKFEQPSCSNALFVTITAF
jgi:hypothetical protein